MRVRFDFEGSILAITGGANGIGRALAVSAAEAGARVAILDLDQDAMDATARLNPRIAANHLDVGDRDAVISDVRPHPARVRTHRWSGLRRRDSASHGGARDGSN